MNQPPPYQDVPGFNYLPNNATYNTHYNLYNNNNKL